MEDNFNPEVELFSPIPEDKFDNHMKAARESSMKARQKVFMTQNNEACNRKDRYSQIKTSIY